MTPYDYKRFIDTLLAVVTKGEVSQARIDDAVRRILRVKFALGLFDHPFGDETLLSEVGSAEHRAVAREAVRKSAVLLKNEGQTLPLSKAVPSILLAGNGVDDVGIQCGGWTIDWQGKTGAITEGMTILEAVRQTVSSSTLIHYDAEGNFDDGITAEIGIAVLGEMPYAEGFGDNGNLTLPEENIDVLLNLRARCNHPIVLLISGRPLLITEQLPLIDAFVATWLLGTEAQGVADVLFRDYPFTGKLSVSWLGDPSQVPLSALTASAEPPQWAFGDGLST